MKNVVVYKFRMSDVEDPDLWAGESLYKWEHSESGQWVMKHAIEKPMWRRLISVDTMGYEYIITASFTPENYTYWKLRYQ